MVQIRKTDEQPPRVAIYDVISALTGLSSNHAGKAYRDLAARYPEVHSLGVNFKFTGRGQRGLNCFLLEPRSPAPKPRRRRREAPPRPPARESLSAEGAIGGAFKARAKARASRNTDVPYTARIVRVDGNNPQG